MRLAGKVALVTGASKGIGRGIAVGMAGEGADVVLNYFSDKAGAEAAAQEIRCLGRRTLVLRGDVSVAKDVETMVDAAVREFGRIDVLVNNAGVALWKPFFELTEDVWDRTMNINAKGMFLCSLHVARHMAGMGGVILNISSMAAHSAMDCLVPYCASKGAMTLATKAMAVELAPYGIRVNALAPGTVDIERNRRSDQDYPGDWIPYIPLGRVGEVGDIVKAAVFLASDESSYITGQTIFVCGGQIDYVPMPRAGFARRVRTSESGISTSGTTRVE